MAKKSGEYAVGGNVVDFRGERERRWRRWVYKRFGLALAIIAAYAVVQLGFALLVGILHF